MDRFPTLKILSKIDIVQKIYEIEEDIFVFFESEVKQQGSAKLRKNQSNKKERVITQEMGQYSIADEYLELVREEASGLRDSEQLNKSHKFYKVLQKMSVNSEIKNDCVLERVKGEMVKCPREQSTIIKKAFKQNSYSPMHFVYLSQNAREIEKSSKYEQNEIKQIHNDEKSMDIEKRIIIQEKPNSMSIKECQEIMEKQNDVNMNCKEQKNEYIINWQETWRKRVELINSLQYIDEGLRMFGGLVELLLERGTILTEMRRYQDAISVLQDALTKINMSEESEKVTEQRFVCLYNLGVAYEEEDCLEVAASYYEQCMLIDDQDDDVIYSLAAIYRDTQQFQSALDLYYQAIAKNPTQTRPFFEISTLFLRQGDLDNHDKQLKNLLSIHEGDDQYQISLLYAQWAELLLECHYLDQNALEKAEQAQKLSVNCNTVREGLLKDENLKGDSQKYRTSLGKVYSRLGRHQEALEQFEVYSAYRRNDDEVVVLIANELFALGERKEAINILEKAIFNRNGTCVLWHFTIAKMMYLERQYNEVMRHLQVCLAYAGNHLIQTIILIAHSLNHLKLFQNSIIAYQQALEILSRKNEHRLSHIFNLDDFNIFCSYNQQLNLANHQDITLFISKLIIQIQNSVSNSLLI